MTSRQRLLAAMAHKEVDRIPLSPRMSKVISRYYQSGDIWAYKRFKKEYFDCDPQVDVSFPAPNPFMAIDHLLYLNDVNVEMQCAQNHWEDCYYITRTFRTPAGPLSEKILVPKPGAKAFSPQATRVEHLIKEPGDIEKISYLFPNLENIDFTGYHHSVEEMGDDGLVLMNIPGPMDYWGGEAYAMENMMVDYYERPDFFDALLAAFAKNSIERVRVALEHDVRNFFLVYFYPSLSTGWSPKIIEEKFAPVIQKQTAMIHAGGGLVDYYDDGRLMGSADIFIRAGVDILETCSPPPVGDFNLSEARKRWGQRVTFKGLVDMINVVWRGTPADIDRHIRDIIGQNGGKQALILGTMDNIRPETSDENIAAYFNAANKHR
jgi:hypothetical protein